MREQQTSRSTGHEARCTASEAHIHRTKFHMQVAASNGFISGLFSGNWPNKPALNGQTTSAQSMLNRLFLVGLLRVLGPVGIAGRRAST